jgi:hypothetical protein
MQIFSRAFASSTAIFPSPLKNWAVGIVAAHSTRPIIGAKRVVWVTSLSFALVFVAGATGAESAQSRDL